MSTTPDPSPGKNGKPLSPDELDIVFNALKEGTSAAQVSQDTGVHIRTVQRISSNLKKWGTARKPRTVPVGRPRKMNEEQENALIGYMEDHPKAYLDEITEYLQSTFNVDISQSSISKILKRTGFSLRSNRKRNPQRGRDMRTRLGFKKDRPIEENRMERDSTINPLAAEKRFLLHLVETARMDVHQYMAPFDASHDWAHVLRVVRLAEQIHDTEVARRPPHPVTYNRELVVLAALLHDVGDAKYVTEGQDPNFLVHSYLFSRGASLELAEMLQTIVAHVSYSHECLNPDGVRAVLQRFPELAIVQDADRLDALGAVGVGRAFTFGGAKAREGGMAATVAHFDEKLLKLEGLMKTEAGKQLAKERTERIRTFQSWWNEEVGAAA